MNILNLLANRFTKALKAIGVEPDLPGQGCLSKYFSEEEGLLPGT